MFAGDAERRRILENFLRLNRRIDFGMAAETLRERSQAEFVTRSARGPSDEDILNVRPTEVDNRWMASYVEHRTKLHTINLAKSRYPNIFSHVLLTVEAADPQKDYFFEKRFEDSALKVNVEWTREACEMVYCNARSEDFDCRPGIQPHAYRSGANTFSACNPACFFRKDVERKNANPDVPLMVWSEELKRCYFESQANLSFFSSTETRSDKKFTKRLNTISTGADIYTKTSNELQTFSAYQNKYYCDEFFKDFNPKNRSCEDPWWQTLLGYTLFGTQLVLLVMSACDQNTNIKTSSRDVGLHPDPSQIPKHFLDTEFWRANINEKNKFPAADVMLSDLGFGVESRSLQKRGAYSWISLEGGLVEKFLLYSSVGDVPVYGARYGTRYDVQLPRNKSEFERAFDAENERLMAEMMRFYDGELLLQRSDDPKPPPPSKDDVLEWLKKQFESLGEVTWEILKSFIDPDFLKELAISIGAGIVESVLLDKLKGFVRKKLPMLLNKGINKIFGKASARMFQVAMSKAMAKLVTKLMIKVASRLATALVMTSSGVLTIVGIIELIALALDIFAMFGWDPLGMNNMFDSELYDALFEAEIKRRLEEDGGQDSVSPVTFAMFVMNVNDENADEEDKPDDESEGGGGGGENSTNRNTSRVKTTDRESKENLKNNSNGNRTRNYYGDTGFRTWQRSSPRNFAVRADVDFRAKLRPQYFDDIDTFTLGLFGQYLSFRTGNSYGIRFDWEDDEVALTETETDQLQSDMDIYSMTLRQGDDDIFGEGTYNADLRDRSSFCLFVLVAAFAVSIAFAFVSTSLSVMTIIFGSIAAVCVKFYEENAFRKVSELVQE